MMSQNNGCDTGLATERSHVRLSPFPLSYNDPGQVVHTHISVTEQYNVVQVEGH